jgi:hypothetical protein
LFTPTPERTHASSQFFIFFLKKKEKLGKRVRRRKEGNKSSKMTPVGISSTSFSKPSLWHTPVPYLFTGIGSMLLLIAVALVVLACSLKKQPHSDVESTMAPKPETCVCSMTPVDREPPIFVIVPGETHPSFLAKLTVANNELLV